MDYFDFVDGLFHDQPSVRALRFSLVGGGEAPAGEANILWFVRDDETAVCVAGSIAGELVDHLSQVAR